MVEDEVRPVVVPQGRTTAARRLRLEQPPLPDLMAIFEHRWYLVQVPSGRETMVAELMRNHGHQAIVPVVRCWRLANRYARRKSEREFALMSRYIILGFGHDDPMGFDDLRRFSFVHSVASDGGGYEQMSRFDLIQFVKFLGTSTWTVDNAQRFMRTGREFKAGDRVEVLSGSLMGWAVTVKRIDGDVAEFEAPMLGRLMTVRLPIAILGKAA